MPIRDKMKILILDFQLKVRNICKIHKLICENIYVISDSLDFNLIKLLKANLKEEQHI